MTRGIALLCALIAVAGSANATTLTITPDKSTYHVGETITLSIVGDPQGATGFGIFGMVLFDPSLASYQSGSQQALTSFGGQLTWLRGVLTCNTRNPRYGCYAFNQIGGFFGGSPANATADNPLLASMQLLAVAPGVLDLSWEIDPRTGNELAFFGLTNAPGASVTIVNPEPATAALLALGLLQLAASRGSMRRK